MSKRGYRTLFVFIVLYALCILVRLVSNGNFSSRLTSDENDYFSISTNLLEGKGFTYNGEATAWRTPGYPVFLAGLRKIVGDNIVNLRIASIFIVSLIAPLIYIFCIILFRDNPRNAQKIGIISSLFWTGMLFSINLSGSLMGEELSTLIFILYLIVACLALRKNSFWLLLLGTVLLTSAIYVRGTLLLVLFAMPIVLCIRRKWILALGLLLASFVLIGSWCLRNYSKLGIFTMSTESAEILWLGNCQFAKGGSPGLFNSISCAKNTPQYEYLSTAYPGFCGKREIEKAKIFSAEIKNNLFAFIKRGVYLIPKKTVIFFSPISWMGIDIAYFISFCFCIIALVYLHKTRKIDAAIFAVIILPVIFCLFISLLTYADIRHRHPINIQVAILGGYGVLLSWGRFKNQISKKSPQVM